MKVYVITRFDITTCFEHIVCIRSDKQDAKKIVDRLNRHSIPDCEYRLTSYLIDGEETYD